jgi:hypothetical protein
MRSKLALLSALVLSLASLFAFPISAQIVNAASSCTPTTAFCYFHGVPGDQANKATTPGGTATFNDTAPTGTVPITQVATPFANRDFVGNPLSAFWKGPFTGSVSGLLELKWFWSTSNAEATALGAELQVSVFADPDFAAANPVQPERLIGRAFVVLTNVTAAPKEFTSLVPVNGTVANTLLIQVVPRFVDTGQGLLTHYDAASTQSRFHFIAATSPPAVSFDTTPVAFAPSTVVSAHFLGAEPQTTLERRLPNSNPGRLDPKRIFVDWPLTSRTQTSQLSRSTDGSDSFRLLFDPTCASRNRPNCLSLGGGDSENEVNLVNGNVYFLDQEALVVNEGLGSSIDHGDTFPATRDHAITNTATAVDRQWLAWVDPFALTPVTRVEAFMAYHVPIAGQFIQGIDQNGVPIAQPVPQITLVNQSGSLRVDNSGGPAHRWIYQPYRGPGGVTVATAFGPDYALPTKWVSTVVSADTASIFPWLNIDSAGNAYLVWVAGGEVFLSIAPINDTRNAPATGRPGSFWTQRAKVNIPAVTSAVFPEVTAGDFGRIAITYMGSEDCAPGPSDACGATSHWNTYVGIIADALALVRGTTMTVSTGKVSHRVVHRGSICTGGTTCAGDRSLLDMTDLGFDEAGRVGVVFMDNNNRLAAPTLTDTTKNGPFAEFAKQTDGPSLLATTPDIRVTIPKNARSDPAGDATWPNRAGAPNLPSLDLLGASISINASNELVVRLPLQEATRSGMARDLAAYNNTFLTDNNAERLQYVAVFATADDVFHLSMEFNTDGTVRFFGGRLDANDKVENGTGATVGSRYVADTGFTVTGTLGHGALTLRAPASQFGVGLGSPLFSVTGFATAAPSESNLTARIVTNSARTIDATPPFDATLQQQAEPPATVDCTDENITTFGGWHTLTDSRAGGGTLCRNVGANKFQSGAFLQFQFRGTSIDVIAAKGPRGGNFNVSLDGARPTKVDLFRPPTDPTHPDNSGRQDLTFGVNVFHRDTGPGTHTLRIDVLNDDPNPLRDMAYLDEFIIAAGDIVTPTSVGTADIATTVTGRVTGGVASIVTFAVDAGTRHVALVIEAAANIGLTLRDAAGTVVGTAQAAGGVVTIDVGPLSVGLATAVLTADVDEAFEMWQVLTENR